MPGYFYILRLESGSLYCGSAHNLNKRLQQHCGGSACRTTTIDPPTAVVHSEAFEAYKEAYRREMQVKRWSRRKKEALIRGDLPELKRLARRRKR